MVSHNFLLRQASILVREGLMRQWGAAGDEGDCLGRVLAVRAQARVDPSHAGVVQQIERRSAQQIRMVRSHPASCGVPRDSNAAIERPIQHIVEVGLFFRVRIVAHRTRTVSRGCEGESVA